MRPASELGEPGSLGSVLHGPAASAPPPCILPVKKIPAWRLEGALAYPHLDPECRRVEDQDHGVHCRALFSDCLELARETKSFGSLNATDFNKVDFKCTYESRLRDRSVLLNYSQI